MSIIKSIAFKSKVSSKSFFAIGLKFFGLLASYVFTVLISTKYGPEGLGVYTLVYTVALVAIYFGKLGLDTALLRFTAELPTIREEAKIFGVYLKSLVAAVVATLFLSSIIFFSREYIAAVFFEKPELSDYLIFSALFSIPHVLILLHSEGIRGLHRSNTYIFLQSISIFFFSIMAILGFSYFFRPSSDDFHIPVLAYFTGLIITLILSTGIWLSGIKLSTSSVYRSPAFKAIFAISMPLFMSNIMLVLLGWSDTLLVGKFMDESSVGYYNVAIKISNVVLIGKLAINGMAASGFAAKHSEQNLIALKEDVRKSFRIILLVSLPIYLLLLLFPQFFLGFFGSEFKIAAPVLLILCTGQFINTLGGTSDIFLQMTGSEKLFRNIMIVATVANICMNLIFIPKFGLLGAAGASLITLLFYNSLCVYHLLKKLELSLPMLWLRN